MEDSYNDGEWTVGRFRGFITSLLRSGTRRWPPKYRVLNAAKTTKKKNKLTGRVAQHYECNACKKDFPKKQVQVDHIQPIHHTRDESWDSFINMLFCNSDNLQVLCVVCHKVKTLKEKK